MAKTITVDKDSGIVIKMADTSNYSLEGVWAHERQHTGQTMQEIMIQSERRFGRPPPRKATLLAWEKRKTVSDQ
ncbi:hypothetical protein ANN_14697 [Periplaneta americana]|uniref:Uncharacterized protein n=1 Tax=Periplaneta americana TaxID=6978 RepID=A0ABQ8SX32_PERAM|nr:hypothetical protein ANN_14697 [Periplaneta americana]